MSGRVIQTLKGDELRLPGVETLEAESGQAVLDLLFRSPVDLIVLDLLLPDAREVLALRGATPVVVAADDLQTALSALESGAADVLLRPIEPALARARLQTCLEMKRLRDRERQRAEELMNLRRELADRDSDLKAAQRKLSELAFTDPLTGIPNRRFAIDALQRLWSAAERSQRPLSCLLLEVDGLRQVNETLGDECGDRMLQTAAQIISGGIRGSDAAARFGGTKFIVLCPDTDGSSVMIVAERLRRRVSESLQESFAQPVKVTVGGADRRKATRGFTDLLNAAEQALAAAQTQGHAGIALYQ